MSKLDYEDDGGTQQITKFIVDQSIGRDVQMRVDYQKQSDPHDPALDSVILIYPNGTEVAHESVLNNSNLVYVAKFGDQEVRGSTAAAASDTHWINVMISAQHLRLCTQDQSKVDLC